MQADARILILMRLADMIMVMPTLLVVLILSALFGQLNIWVIVLMIALFRWPGVARVIRSQTLSPCATARSSRRRGCPVPRICVLSLDTSCPT
jgi:ABC-type microcin C transport system permease subunit YejE